MVVQNRHLIWTHLEHHTLKRYVLSNTFLSMVWYIVAIALDYIVGLLVWYIHSTRSVSNFHAHIIRVKLHNSFLSRRRGHCACSFVYHLPHFFYRNNIHQCTFQGSGSGIFSGAISKQSQINGPAINGSSVNGSRFTFPDRFTTAIEQVRMKH